MPSAAVPPAPSSRHPSALALHEHQLALLPPAEAEIVDRHLSSCELCRTDLANLAGDQRRFEREVFPQTREKIARRRWSWWPLALPTLAAAAAAWLLIAPARLPPEVLPKGDATLAIFVAREGGALSVSDGQRLRPGDRIRFVLRPAGQRHAIVASLDGAGRTTVYHPFDGRQSAALPAGARIEIPGSIVLDRSPGPERVFAVLAPNPFPAALVVEALKKLAGQGPGALRATTHLPLELEAATQQSLLFEKSP
jgi:hypothetical protein